MPNEPIPKIGHHSQVAENKDFIAQAPPTPRQQEAIESWQKGDVCVVAGPGSGKTRVLVDRFRWLVQAKGIPPRRILAITFTDKAAANMRRRLVESFPPDSPERQAVERAHISTIHSFCARLLRENAVEAAVDPGFRVLDEWEADLELERAIGEALEREYLVRPERVREFLAWFASHDVAGSLYGLYQALRAAGVTIAQARSLAAAPDPALAWEQVQETLRQIAALPTTGWNLQQRQALQQALAQNAATLSVNLSHLKRGSPQVELLKRLREILPAWRAAVLLQRHVRDRQWFLDALDLADRLYRDVKRAAGALDYADLEEGAVRLLASPAGARLRSAFSFILMDELQDTNPLQARLVGLLRGPGNFFGVGDINQSIYGFRHADPAVFRDFRDQTQLSGGHLVPPLVENFRSRPEVLAAIERLVAAAEGIEPRPLVAPLPSPPPASQSPPPCIPSPTPNPHPPTPSLEVLAVQADDNDQAPRLEALHVAARIAALVAAGRFRYGDMAILLRTSAQVRLFEKTLREQGLPCEVTEGRGFYDAREVSDLMAFLRVLLNPRDEISLAAVLRSPLAGASDDDLVRLKLNPRSLATASNDDPNPQPPNPNTRPLAAAPNDDPNPQPPIPNTRRLAAGLAAAPEDHLRLLHRRIQRYRRDQDSIPLDRLLARLVSETGYEAWLAAQPGGHHRIANVRKLQALARRFQAAGLAGLREFVERVENLRRDQARESEARPPEQSADAVQLMTIHAAKGLEFPVVFVGAISRAPRPDTEAVTFSPRCGVGMRWRDPQTGEDQPDAIAAAVADDAKRARRDEEQRLFYVALTRAESLLVLSASFTRRVTVQQWAGHLQRNLAIDFKTLHPEPREVETNGIRFRLLVTDQHPAPFAPPPARAAASDTVSLDRPAWDDQADSVVSATSVALFHHCPRRYYLSRYLACPASTDRDQSDPSAFGRQVHALLAGDLSPDTATPEDDPGLDPDQTDPSAFGREVHALLAGEISPDTATPEALRLAAAFHAGDWGRRAALADRVEREQGFLISLDGRLVSGQIDLWFRHDGETVVLDYKTDAVSAAQVPARAAAYELQLRLYALAVQRLAATPVDRAILYFLRPNIPVEVAVDPAALAAARLRVEELFQAQDRLDFPLRTGPHCRVCPHFGGLCPAPRWPDS